MLILFAIYVAYLAAMYQWFLVKPDDISIVLVKVFMSPIPFSTFPFPYGVYGVVVVCRMLWVLYICYNASELYSAVLSLCMRFGAPTRLMRVRTAFGASALVVMPSIMRKFDPFVASPSSFSSCVCLATRP